MVVIWVLRSLRVVVEDPEIIESQLGLPVYATVPHSKTEVELHRKARGGAGELLAVSIRRTTQWRVCADCARRFTSRSSTRSATPC
jgi:hypothetical protein